ncbi:DUF4283 domain-containing protein [Cephalotus follicularis]|uniref:DUF4283 domain-containing protein n=1 Tax=Cephalotus follicularis TaxID=3775 RepID=A0A1Q3C5X6_CEPFO|nr:DUF4283 domain-containing protein [Cephalotus follicularis]
MWKKWGGVSVITGDNGTFLFNFDNSAARDLVLSNGSWEVWGAYLVLRQWEEGMSLSKDSFSSILVWVKLYNIPAELWTKLGLSYVASALGVPLCMDATTTACNRLCFSRVCIEMKASSCFPTSYKVRLRNGTLIDVMVQYSWKPLACLVCRVFYHSSKQCHLAAKKDATGRLGDTGVPGEPPGRQGVEDNMRQGVDTRVTPCEDIPLAPMETCALPVGATGGNVNQEEDASRKLCVGDIDLEVAPLLLERGENIP